MGTVYSAETLNFVFGFFGRLLPVRLPRKVLVLLLVREKRGIVASKLGGGTP